MRFVLKFLILDLLISYCLADIGDFCSNHDESLGVCKLVKNCEGAVEELRYGRIPKVCGFEGTEPIVCCTLKDPPTTTTLPTPKTEIKQTDEEKNPENEYCTNTDQTLGICKSLANCTPSVDNVGRGLVPKVCRFEGREPIICCSLKSQTATTFRPPRRHKIGAKSTEKCGEYAKSVMQTFRPPTLLESQKWVTRDTCGFTRKKNLVIGGSKAQAKEFPHMAAIGYSGPNKSVIYACGGSLVSENFVITTAHCLNHKIHGPAKYVRLGDLDLESTDDEDSPEDFEIIERIEHPNFRPAARYNDIGLLKLNKIVSFNAYIRPICLNVTRRNMEEGRMAIATSWKHPFYMGDSLAKANYKIYNHTECHQTYLTEGIDERSQFCAGPMEDTRNTCQGQTGGPLQVFNKAYCMYTLIGVQSQEKVCGDLNPGIYARIHPNLEWIEKTVWG